jgi:hypothetical protein
MRVTSVQPRDTDVDTRVDSTTVRVDTPNPTPAEPRRRAYKRDWMRARAIFPPRGLL